MEDFSSDKYFFMHLSKEEKEEGRRFRPVMQLCASAAAGTTTSVAKRPKFRPHNSKEAQQKFVRPEKLAAEVYLNMPKRGRTFLKMIFQLKNLKISAEKFTSSSDMFDFSSLCREK
jgi:hypothetical protein